MVAQRTFTFKIADEDWEFRKIHRLNYDTFVEEIRQHGVNDRGSLVDKFHDENNYIICLQDDELIGMVALRDKRPFSLDHKLGDVDDHLPCGYRKACEIRLFATVKKRRGGYATYGLLRKTAAYCLENGYDLALISGVLNQRKLYRHLGFKPFGPVVGSVNARFQPMYLQRDDFLLADEWKVEKTPAIESNFTTGPAGMSPETRQGLRAKPISHRSEEFIILSADTKRRLCELVNAKRVALFFGSGTLANDVIAGQLANLSGRGVIMANGEFGERLVGHARGFDLNCVVREKRWGAGFDAEAVESTLDEVNDASWLWIVHCETSTGTFNDLGVLKRACWRRGVRLCLDCVSSVGAVAVDLDGVYLASGVSGKALESFPGVAMVFHNHEVTPSKRPLPVYLDLYNYASRDGSPYTASSNMTRALNTSLTQLNMEEKRMKITHAMKRLRNGLSSKGWTFTAPDEFAAPHVLTISLPLGVDSVELGDSLVDKGVHLSYQSDYLIRRNWIQICFMGRFAFDRLEELIDSFPSATRERTKLDDLPK